MRKKPTAILTEKHFVTSDDKNATYLLKAAHGQVKIIVAKQFVAQLNQSQKLAALIKTLLRQRKRDISREVVKITARNYRLYL